MNLRLTGVARKILKEMASKAGISQADVLELLLRQEQKKKSDIELK